MTARVGSITPQSFSDGLTPRDSSRLETRSILDELTRQSVADWFYDDSYQDNAEALEDAQQQLQKNRTVS